MYGRSRHSRRYWPEGRGLTMYSVMLVDDEPAAIRYLTAIIEKKCPQYEVVATANDGREALEKVKTLQPDVLLFDIRMPVVDGLAMSSAIKRMGLPVIMIVVSGYSEFEYARRAMGNGAVDYLLKPAAPREVQSLFARLSKTLAKRYYGERMRLLRRLYRDAEIPARDIRKYFGDQKFHVALARQNGLPMRFSPQNSREVFSEMHELLITYGRDEMENLYLCPVNLLYHSSFEEVVTKQIQKETAGPGYRTVILSREAVSCDKICPVVKRLYQVLDHNVILGKTHTVYIEDYAEKPVVLSEEEKSALAAFQYYAEKGDCEKAKRTAERLLQMFDRRERGLLWVEREVRNMYMILAEIGGREKYDGDYMENEYAIEEAFSTSQDISQLIANVQDILFKEAEPGGHLSKLDTEEFISRVCAYIEKHLETIQGPQELCRQFGVSQTYLGKLFRKYRDMSLNTYLTESRMEKAKELIQSDPELLIKDVAVRLGYRDQFYFSRVFRSYTGMCPTEFVESLREA